MIDFGMIKIGSLYKYHEGNLLLKFYAYGVSHSGKIFSTENVPFLVLKVIEMGNDECELKILTMFGILRVRIYEYGILNQLM